VKSGYHWHLTADHIIPTAIGVAIVFQATRLGCVWVGGKGIPVVSKGAQVLGSLFTFGGA
jgi:hypothetical protein